MIKGDTEGSSSGIVYGLWLGSNDWLVVGLAVPNDQNALLLDETVVLPILHSLDVTGPMSPVSAEPVEEMTPSDVLTATPLALEVEPSPPVTRTPAPTATPESSDSSPGFSAVTYDLSVNSLS